MRLAECVEYLSRGKSPNYVDSSEINVINQACIYWGGINNSKVKYQNPNSAYEKAVIRNRDVLINSTGTGTLGRAAVYYDTGEIAIADSHVTIIRTDKQKLLPEFLCLYLRSTGTQKELYAKCVSGSTNQIELSKEKLLAFTIPEIPVEEQHAIVTNLGKISRIVAIRNEELSALDELIKARFVELFGDISINSKNWPILPLGDLCTIVRGGSPRPIEQFLGGDIPWIKIGDAAEGESIYLTSTKEHIIQEGVKKSRLVKAGSLIFADCGVSLGFARIITFDGCIHDGWLAMEDIDERLDKIFLLQTLNQMTEHFRKMAPAGTQPNLNTAIMKAYQQIIPPMNLQKEFITFLEKIDKSKSAIQKSLDETQLLFDSLMQQYFG